MPSCCCVYPVCLCFFLPPGLCVGNEILIINGESVSELDLRQMELLFSEKSVHLTLTTNLKGTKTALCSSLQDGIISKEARKFLPPHNQSQLLEEFLDNFRMNTANGEMMLEVLQWTSCIKRAHAIFLMPFQLFLFH